ncbi:MAG: DJ-1/PfpI family protein [Gemmatimonadales bacterium]|nr:DJ-1/PfpI family protein [Gemmatimonadales bacterium]
MLPDAPPPRRALLYVFDGYADWEPALALCELRQEGGFRVETFSDDGGAVVSRGGLRVMPDRSLRAVEAGEPADLLVLPGGDRWTSELPPGIGELARAHLGAGRTVAAICGAVLGLAAAGVLAGRDHASNGQAWLEEHAGDYEGQTRHVDALACADGGLITASGAAPVEFARLLLERFEVYPAEVLPEWFTLFKTGELPG